MFNVGLRILIKFQENVQEDPKSIKFRDFRLTVNHGTLIADCKSRLTIS